MRTKNLQTSYSESFEIPYGTGADGNLETAIDELREKSDMDIADFKVMLDAAYKDKVRMVDGGDLFSVDSENLQLIICFEMFLYTYI